MAIAIPSNGRRRLIGLSRTRKSLPLAIAGALTISPAQHATRNEGVELLPLLIQMRLSNDGVARICNSRRVRR